MIKARGRSLDGRTVLLFGLSRGNCERLLEGKPILIYSEEMGVKGLTFIIQGGETEADMAKEIVASNPGIQVNEDGTIN